MSLDCNLLLPFLTSRLAFTDDPAIKTLPERTASLEILRVLNNLTHHRNLSILISSKLKHFGYFTIANNSKYEIKHFIHRFVDHFITNMLQ